MYTSSTIATESSLVVDLTGILVAVEAGCMILTSTECAGNSRRITIVLALVTTSCLFMEPMCVIATCQTAGIGDSLLQPHHPGGSKSIGCCPSTRRTYTTLRVFRKSLASGHQDLFFAKSDTPGTRVGRRPVVKASTCRIPNAGQVQLYIKKQLSFIAK